MVPKTPSRLTCLVAVIVFGWTAAASACNYGRYGLTLGKEESSTVDGLFRGEYFKHDSWKLDDWKRAAIQDENEIGDTAGRLNYAWALLMSGQSAQAMAVYQKLLQAEPASYEVLCSYATALHILNQWPAAMETLKKAIALKPGFRDGAEEFHLQMLEFEWKARQNYDYARENLFVPELTSLWKNRRGPDQNFSTVPFPPGLSSRGVAGLLRQFPRFGEGWLVLGMLLEHEKDFSMAAKAYDRAVERGTARQDEIKRYQSTFREFGRYHDPGRRLGRGIKRLIIGLVAVGVFLYLYRVLARVIWDISSSRAMKQEQARRERRKNDNGPLR